MKIGRWFLAALTVLAILAVGVIASQTRREQGFLAPIFSPDGTAIFVVVREARATVLGLGYEMLTPPADIRVHKDRFSLRRIDVQTGRTDTVEAWPASPLEGTHIREYRGRVFGVAQAHLRWADPEHLEYALSVTRPDTPTSENFTIFRKWDAERRQWMAQTTWARGPQVGGGDEPEMLAGTREVIAVPGRDLMPCGVAVLEEARARVDVVAGATRCASLHPAGVTPALLAPLTRRTSIERSRLLERTYQDLIAQGVARGLGANDAALAAIKEMERLGYYPRSPQITARPLTPEAVKTARTNDGLRPLFAISEMEFRAGLFQDIEKALASPGAPVDKSIGPYIRHRDYSTSETLNRFLGTGGHVFFVERGGQVYELTVDAGG